MPGLLLGQLGSNTMCSRAISDTQTVTCVLSHLIAGSSAKSRQSDVKQPLFLVTSRGKFQGGCAVCTECIQLEEVRARKGF